MKYFFILCGVVFALWSLLLLTWKPSYHHEGTLGPMFETPVGEDLIWEKRQRRLGFVYGAIGIILLAAASLWT